MTFFDMDTGSKRHAKSPDDSMSQAYRCRKNNHKKTGVKPDFYGCEQSVSRVLS